jgi:hypothetical protein
MLVNEIKSLSCLDLVSIYNLDMEKLWLFRIMKNYESSNVRMFIVALWISASTLFTQAALDLGTCKNGFGFGGTGKKSNNRQFDDYGESFGLHDVIGCYLDLDNMSISFSKGGQPLGQAFTLRSEFKSVALFPAVVLKVTTSLLFQWSESNDFFTYIFSCWFLCSGYFEINFQHWNGFIVHSQFTLAWYHVSECGDGFQLWRDAFQVPSYGRL